MPLASDQGPYGPPASQGDGAFPPELALGYTQAGPRIARVGEEARWQSGYVGR